MEGIWWGPAPINDMHTKTPPAPLPLLSSKLVTLDVCSKKLRNVLKPMKKQFSDYLLFLVFEIWLKILRIWRKKMATFFFLQKMRNVLKRMHNQF